MPSAIRIEGGWLVDFRDKFRFVVVDDDQAARGGLQLLDQFPIAGARWMDVQGSCGVHDLLRSVVEEFSKYQPLVDLCQQP